MLYGSVGRVGLRALLGSVAFTPLSLFAAGEQGVWFDNSISYMDELGPELVANGTFDSGTTSWTLQNATASVSGGQVTLTNTAANGGMYQAIPTVVGRLYTASIQLIAVTGASNVLFFIKSDSTDWATPNRVNLVNGQSSVQTYTAAFTATATTSYIHVINGTSTVGHTVTVDNITVKEVVGLANATLFQDAAGTTPVTGYEQFVGLRLDKSKGLVASTKGGQITGVSGSGFDTPSAAANQITSDIDIRVQASMVSWASANTVFCSRIFTGVTTADAYEFWISSTGVLRLLLVSGTTATDVSSSVSVGFAAGTTNWVRVTWQQSTGYVNFYTSSDGVTWTQNGAANRAGQTSAINAGTRFLRIGARTEGNFTLNGKIYRAQIYNGINGTLAVDFNPTLYTGGATFTAATSEVWTITGSNARIVPDGNHAYQTNINARAVLSARYNLLSYTEAFDNAYWDKSGAAVSKNAVDPNGVSNSAFTLTANTTGVYTGLYRNLTVDQGSTLTVYAKKGSANFLGLSTNTGAWASFNLDIGETSNSSGCTPEITAVGGGWYRCSAKNTTSGNSFFIVSVKDTTGASNPWGNRSTASGSFIYIWGADLRAANESSALPAYQRVGAAVNGTSTSIGTPDYDTVGFPAYLRYDGGDWYQTNSIDFSTGATNPPLGPELVTNGDFSNGSTGWTLTGGWTVVAGALSGTSVGNGEYATSSAFTVVAGRTYRMSLSANVSSGSVSVRFDTGAQEIALGTVSSSGQYSFYVVAPDNSSVAAIRSLGFTGTIDNISVKELTDANYAPDKMSVFAGVRKLSDADTSLIAELSSTYAGNPGTFAVIGRPTGGYSFGSNGSVSGVTATAATEYPAPVTNILTGIGNISADICTLRVNSLQVAQSTADQGTGNYGNYPLYIGARGGTSNFYIGRDYGWVILGRAVTATELTNTEGYMETQTFGKDMAYVYSDELTTATGDLITAADGDQIYMTVQYV